tara:strand:- start:14676 stop:15113 length:438 start_codon:yes stop_codon:yes gene_type:complete
MGTNDRRRAKLLARMLRLREIEHQRAAGEAAQALAAAQRSERLAERARALAATEIRREEVDFGEDLARRLTSGARLRDIAHTVERQAEHAQSHAQLRMQQERMASRRRDQIEERRDALFEQAKQRLVAGEMLETAGGRRIGTDRE